MSLINPNELKKIAGLSNYGKLGDFFVYFIMNLFKLNKINHVYDTLKHLPKEKFLASLFRYLQFYYEVYEADLKRIPKSGPFITISNHPLGGLDGIILIKLLSEIRPDYKIMANFLLNKIEPLSPYLFSVNPFEDQKEAYSNLKGIKEIFNHLKKGHPMGLFPGGEVSTFQKDLGKITDIKWQASVAKLIRKSKVPVIPIYFHGKNSWLFYELAKLSTKLRTLMLPREFFYQKGQLIRVRIGNAISVSQIENIEKDKELSDMLRKKTYMLANFYDKKNNLFKDYREQLRAFRKNKKVKKIINSVPVELIKKELKNLSPENLLFESHNYEIFFSHASKIPNTLTQIGRLREITFREVGEGTNKAIDLDKYDAYYHHLFLWDKKQEELVGAYRLGLGKEIFSKYGIKGFYLSELFDFDAELNSFFEKAIEMGRAFLVKKYQQKPLPLFLLWRGIIHITLIYPQYKYLIGAVSISRQFSNFSISMMVEFMKSHFYDPFMAQYVRPKKEYKIKLNDEDKEFILEQSEADLNKFDKIIDEIEPGALRIPVLIKKYIKQKAQVVAFNLDPNFNNVIDGLMYIQISDIPQETIKPVLEEFLRYCQEKEKP